MKILKIELQNINSLKSDLPIVIDFESEKFKDVGLYAITGSTGAGKTTILDAITIALYHSVPRFNGTKGTLIDVVSHSANDAFSRVTFENNTIIYEAFWGIRVANKTGKRYKNAKEEVRLKKLSTGVILATQKRALISEVNKVTQLDYNQFLRSVMLAQGEFASFLSAKGPDKGRLLEQIMGEQIYKKIGQGVLDRKSKEENKLKEIQSKINSDDVLTDEDIIELNQKDKVLDVAIIKTDKDIKSTQFIVDWYIDFQELINKTEKLDQGSKELDIFIDKHKAELELLGLNEKAEPFKELIQNINRTEKNSIEKSKQLENLETELTLLKPEIESISKLTKNHSADLEIADKGFTEWLPKFDLITKLETQLKNQSENKQTSKQKLDELNEQIKSLEKEKGRLAENLDDTDSKINSDEVFVSQHKFLKEVELNISNWTRELTSLNASKKTLNEDSEFIAQKNQEIDETTVDLKTNKELLSKKIVEVEKIEKERSTVTAQLAQNNITDLVSKIEQLSLIESNWKQFKVLSEQIIKAEKEQTDLLAQKIASSTDLESIKKQVETFTTQIKAQEESVADAAQILDLEKSISKYEADRLNLIIGEPCGLCGSKEHPYTVNIKSIGVSKSQLELNTRKDTLKTLTDSKIELGKNEVKLHTTIGSLTQQIKVIIDELKGYKTTASQLNIDCELSNLTKIKIELNVTTEQLKSLVESLKIAQELQTKNNELSESIKTKTQSVSTLKTTVATFSEKIKNSNSEIDSKQKSVDSLSQICTVSEKELKTKLSKFNYELPTVEYTQLFIQELEKSIANYNKIQKDLDSLKAAKKVIDNNLINNKKQLEADNKAQSNYTKAISECDEKSNTLNKKRDTILPTNISVESKRESLQSSKKQLADKVELTKKNLQKLLDSNTEKEALKVKNNKEQKDLTDELSVLQSSLNSQIQSSGFESKKDIENALLTTENKLKFTKNKEEVKENKLKLETLKEVNVKAKEDLHKSKNFETSETECKVSLEDLKIKNKSLSTEKGKIAEAFRKDQEIRDRNQEIYKKIDAQAEVCTVWKELFKIIGKSKDAFNVYVQRLTLKHLLDLANVHLFKLNKRYSLKLEEIYNPKEELNFNLIDHYQTDQARLVDTSSGGEKFIISLALALGLSDLASKNVKIGSLFIDEGFGTLDNNTLETVISTLETLQSQGKIIGIISHVENLKERISTQIQITKKSNGVSVVDII